MDGPANGTDQALAWFPDWRGQYAAILASGPSVRPADVAKLAGKVKAIAIKRTVELAPWADVLYGCDAAWWQSRQGFRQFPGLKIGFTVPLEYRDWLHKIEIDRSSEGILVKRPGLVGSGGNSGFQALNLAVQFGARGVLLVGLDCFDRGENRSHWYGANDWHGSNNPYKETYERWAKAFNEAAPTIAELGVEVINSSLESRVTAFPKMTIDEALAKWGI